MNYLTQASEGVQLLASVVLALYGLASSLSLVLGFLGSFYPPALVWARQCSNVGLRLHNFGAWLGSLLPGGQPPAAAQLASLKPSPVPVICTKCGAGPKAPGFATLHAMLVVLFVAALLALLSGCITSAPIVPETPANQTQIAACDGTATLHNQVVIGDFVLGGATTGLAAGAAVVSDGNTRTALAVAGAVAGGITTIGAALAAYTASNFANSKCSSVVGALPVGTAKP